jgi:cellulose biosynthesis protein BcsQ
MNRDEIRAQIQANLDESEIEASELRVQQDPYGGWNIVVISSDFEGIAFEERKALVLDTLSIEVEWVDLLTPQEREWAGTLPADIDIDDLPLWPEAMGRSLDRKDELTFLSDLETDIALPITATFYSHRGGVGRSTALGYAARILADRGHTVLCVDMDLEAPGLAALFGQGDSVRDGEGLVPLLFHLDQGGDPDIMNHILRVSETDELYCLPAGRPSAEYARMLRFIDPTAYYQEEENPLRNLVDQLKEDLSFKPDVLLFDARTGLNALNGPLLFDLSDLAIIAFFPHPQAQDGTRSLINGLLSSYTSRTNGNRLTPEPRFIVSPIPSSPAAEVVERYRLRSADWIQDWLEPIDGKRSGGESFGNNSEDLTHYVTYQEAIATSDAIRSDEDIWGNYTQVADWIEGFLPSEKEQEINEQSEQELQKTALEEFDFPAGTAEHQPRLLQTYVRTRGINKALKPGIPLVRGRKGMGKTALFRRLLEDPDTSRISILGPPSLEEVPDWQPTKEAFKEVEKIIGTTDTSWSAFWTAYIGLTFHLQRPHSRSAADISEKLHGCIPVNIRSPLDTVDSIEDLLELDRSGLLLTEWIKEVDNKEKPKTLLLFDRLDVGFGNDEQDRERRKDAIEGLFSLFLDVGSRLDNLQFKILLREDIWKNLEFENKSHLFGRSVQLEWDTKADFIEVIVRHALRSEAFRSLADQTDSVHRLPDDLDAPAEVELSDEEVYDLWYLLVGERMRGAKTTYTYNWVWSRLADGTDNHSPRPLLQLFREANEREQHQDQPYDKSIIRPRALIESLDTVSERALDALVTEEFQELKPLVDQLEDIGRTPVDAEDLHDLPSDRNLDDEIDLALKVGLLEIYEGTEEDIRRYKVPDLYRFGVGMTRKGKK